MTIKDHISEAMLNDLATLPTYDKAIELISLVIKLSVEEALKVLPLVAANVSNQAVATARLKDEVYEKNKKLAENKELTAKIIEQTEAENPGLSYKEIVNKAVPKALEAVSRMEQIKVSKPNKAKVESFFED